MHFSFRSKVSIVLSLVVITSACLAFLTISRSETHAATSSQHFTVKSNGLHSTSALSCGGWSIVPSPLGASNDLVGVAATATNDAWAVGSTFNGSNDETLIEHWDGTSWSIVPSINPGTSTNQLLAISSTSVDDAWAVGNAAYITGNNALPLIEHWDGTSWSLVSSPSAGSYNILTGVTALSSSDVWAVGYFSNSNTPAQTLIEHWDGTSWSIISSPDPDAYNRLQGVVAVSSSDVWAVGSTGDNNNMKTLIEHWDGTNWNLVRSPNPDLKFNELLGITQVPGTTRLWAVGDYGHTGSSLVEHWDGTSWSVVSIAPAHLYLHGVAAVPGTSQSWIVGQHQDLKTGSTGSLIEFYC